MILRYGSLSRKPALFQTMSGLSVALFDDLIAELAPAYAQATYTHRNRPGRQRAVGAGHPRRLDVRDEFLLTVVWLRHYFQQEALGYFFGVSDTTALRTIARVLPVLEATGRDTMRQPPPSRRQRLGVAEALAAFPALAGLDDASGIIDTWEQRVQRPTDRTAADRHYSGKKKAHTLKTPVVVEAGSGCVRSVRPGVCGPVADPTVLRLSQVLEHRPATARHLGDGAYIGADPRVLTPRRQAPRPGASGGGRSVQARRGARPHYRGTHHSRPAALPGAQFARPPPPSGARRARVCRGRPARPPLPPRTA